MNKDLIQVCVETVKNPQGIEFAAGSLAKGDKRINEEIRGILGFSANDRITRMAFNKAMRSKGTQVFEIIEEVLNQTFLGYIDENEFFRQFADTRNLALGDANEFVLEDDGILTVSEVSNGNWDIRRQKLEGGESITVPTRTYGAKMYADFFDFVMGRITFAHFIAKVSEAFAHHVNGIVARSFEDAQERLPADFTVTGAADVTQLEDLVQKVSTASGSATVVGTRAALSKFIKDSDVAWMTEEQKTNLQKTGMLGYYRGMRLVQMPQVFKNNSFDFAYSDDKVLVIPASDQVKPVKLVLEGEVMVNAVQDNTTNRDQTLEYTVTSMYGAEVVFEGLFGVYHLE